MKRIVAIVGMTGSGKSTVADILVGKGFQYLRFGQITLDEIRRRGLPVSEDNEKKIREELRREHGMAAYAKLNLLNIKELLAKGDVVIDGLYSWEEYTTLKDNFGSRLVVLAVFSSPDTRYLRLEKRSLDVNKDKGMRFRPTTREESSARDRAEIQNLNKTAPIAMADYTIVNEGSVADLEKEAEAFMKRLNHAKAVQG